VNEYKTKSCAAPNYVMIYLHRLTCVFMNTNDYILPGLQHRKCKAFQCKKTVN